MSSLESKINKLAENHKDLYSGRELRRLASRYNTSPETVTSSLRAQGWTKGRSPSGTRERWLPPPKQSLKPF